MDIGIGLWCLQSTATNPRSFGRAYQELTEDARLAEQHGIHSLWLSEHHGYYDGYCPALMPAAPAALAATENLQVGTGVLLALTRTATRRQRCKSPQPKVPRKIPPRFRHGLSPHRIRN